MIVKAKKLWFIIFILVFLQTTLWYKYNFSQFSGSSVWNQDNAAWTPQFVSGYNGYGTGIMKLRQGVMILPGTVVSTNSGMNQGSTGTLWFTVFIFNVNQLSTLYTVTSTGTRNSYLNFKINNGKMRIESGTYNSGSYNASPTKETSSSSMYSTGWNLIWYTLSNTNFNFYSYPRFTTSVVSESATNTTFETNNGFIGIFGGLINSAGTSFSNSFQGIIHTIDIQSTTYMYVSKYWN